MKTAQIKKIFGVKHYLIAALGIISFSHFIVHLFGQTIPNIVLSFFKDMGEAVVLGSVFVFALIWIVRIRPHKRPKKYSIVIFDVFGKESQIDGIRTTFKTHDVAWSFMKQYKHSYPLHNFALVSDVPKSNRKTIFKYI